MSDLLGKIARAALFRLDAEIAHSMTISGLKAGQTSGLMPKCANDRYRSLAVNLAGLTFANPVGMAAGFDKNGEVPNALMQMGFGFAEIGTVTPRPQSGNAKPRIFRLVRDNAVINRLGFNNSGHTKVLENLQSAPLTGIVGVNIGANKDSENFIDDYIEGLGNFWDIASYFTANISSPNTPGLRNLQTGEALRELLLRLSDERDVLAARGGRMKPVFLKIAPDLDEGALDEIAQCLKASSIDGLIVSNTTISRPDLHDNTNQQGGLSGRPLFELSTIILAKMRLRLGNDFPIIGVGGIDSVETAWQKIEAGADLLQLYTGMIYQGPGLSRKICEGLFNKLENSGIDNISLVTSSKCEKWAKLPIVKGK